MRTPYSNALTLLFATLWSQGGRIGIRLGGAFMVMLTTIAFNLTTPFMLKHVLTNLEALPTTSSFYLFALLICYALLWTSSRLMHPLRELLIFRIVERSIQKLNCEFINHIFSLSAPFLTNQKHGDLANILQRATYGISTLVYGFLFYLFPVILEMLIASLLLAHLFGIWYGAGLALMFFLLCTFSFLASQSFRSNRRKTNKLHGKVSAYFSEILLNFETISYLGTQQKELGTYRELLKEKGKSETKNLMFLETIYIGHTLLIGLGFSLFTLALGQQIISGARSIADLMMLHGYLIQFFLPLGAFGIIIRDTYRAMADMERFHTVLSTPPVIIDTPNASILTETQVSIVFENVTFAYPDKDPILKNASFEIQPGDIVTLVGKTGTGKSTIIKLLYRLYDVQEGNILINDQNIKTIKRTSLSGLFGIVPQDPILLNKSIAENIAYGVASATPSEIEAAAQQAQLSTWIQELPDKYGTIVGEQGVRVSRGERQRIAVARALLKNPSMYIFDEATASLDEQTKNYILKNIKSKCYGKTMLFITHQPWSMIAPNKELALGDKTVIVRAAGSGQPLRCDRKRVSQMSPW